MMRKLAENQRLAQILERRIDGVNDQLHYHRLVRPCQHQTRSRFCHQIVGRFAQPLLVESRAAYRHFKGPNDRTEVGVFCRGQNFSRERIRERRDLACGTAQTMVRQRAGEREMILDDVKAVHRVLRRAHSPAGTECAHRCEITLATIEKIAVQRQDHICAIELGYHTKVATETQFRGKALRLAQKWFVHDPAETRKNLLQLRAQPLTRGRMRFLDQECKTVALLHEERFAQLRDMGFKRRAIALLPTLNEALRARWIVKIENGRLRERVGRATARRMERIPIEFRRPAVMRSDNKRNGAGAPRHRGGVEKWLARNRPFDALCKWNQMCFRTAAAR